MERRKLVYNALKDIWEMAQNPCFRKSKAETTDDDWEKIFALVQDKVGKYNKLRPEESEFFLELFWALTNLIDREDKLKFDVSSDGKTKSVWTNAKYASMYGVTFPGKEPNHQPPIPEQNPQTP